MGMTPLESAKQKQAHRTCVRCERLTLIDGVAYCEKSGKLLHPYLLDGEAKCPHEIKAVKQECGSASIP